MFSSNNHRYKIVHAILESSQSSDVHHLEVRDFTLRTLPQDSPHTVFFYLCLKSNHSAVPQNRNCIQKEIAEYHSQNGCLIIASISSLQRMGDDILLPGALILLGEVM